MPTLGFLRKKRIPREPSNSSLRTTTAAATAPPFGFSPTVAAAPPAAAAAASTASVSSATAAATAPAPPPPQQRHEQQQQQYYAQTSAGGQSRPASPSLQRQQQERSHLHPQQQQYRQQQQQEHPKQEPGGSNARSVTSTPLSESMVVEPPCHMPMNPVSGQPPTYINSSSNSNNNNHHHHNLAQPAPTPLSTDHQNPLSIGSLINAQSQQHDSGVHGQAFPPPYASQLDQRLANPATTGSAAIYASASPHQQQQSQGDHHQHMMQQVQELNLVRPPPQLFSQSPAQQQGQSPLPQQQQNGIDDEPQVRITKGKYSLGDFEILRTLGTGSFGRVHLVQSRHNQRFYAVKVLKKKQVERMKQIEHTNDERRMLAEVKHPFLITLWGTFQDNSNLYMVMDFVEGGELFSLLRKSGRFPNPVAKFYAAEVALALEYLHCKNIIYRDLKPENLLLDRHGHLKITDFGFAKRVPDKTWTLCGTPDYLAPEVVSNKGYNKSVDWWSLGILIYEMLCGYTPFWDSRSPMKIYENILKGRVKYPDYINPDARDLLERLITADLTKRLGNLYGGPQDVKNHPWFTEVTWDRLARKDIDAPYTPPVRAGAGDASQFDRYPEEMERYGDNEGVDEFADMFLDF